MDKNYNILNYNGEIAAVVHQYDRKHSIVSKLKTKFNDSFFYINNSLFIKENKSNSFIKLKLEIKFFFMLSIFVFVIMACFLYFWLKKKRQRNIINFRKVKLKVFMQKMKKFNLYKKTEDYSLISEEKIINKILI